MTREFSNFTVKISNEFCSEESFYRSHDKYVIVKTKIDNYWINSNELSWDGYLTFVRGGEMEVKIELNWILKLRKLNYERFQELLEEIEKEEK